MRGNERAWILFAHVCTWSGIDEEEFFVDHLDKMGKRMQSFKAPGASVYLYDLNNTGIDR